VAMKRIFAAVAFMISAFVHAASPYPEKSITIVNPFGAGTASDTVIRALGNRLGSALNVPVVVENRPGANGIVGTLRGVRAPNDGYTIFVTTGTTVSQNSWLFKDINYDPMTDFVGIAVLGGFPLSIVVPPQSPYRDFKELMQAIHTSTQGITYATAYGMQTVCGELLGKAAKGKVLGIPYKSTPPAVLDVTAGRVAFACGETATTLSALQGRTLRALAVINPGGSKYIPGVPSVQESLPDFPIMQSWIGLAAPRGIDSKKVELLSREIYKIASDPAFADSLSGLGYASTPMDAAATAQFMKSDFSRWRDLIKHVGIQPQ
ncbi:Bug family tripartite tricarboxylate transporter substrate binding protein, partial [Bordetella pertussis]